MRIVQLTPGTGNFYCGNCMRDNAMVNAMRAAGHDALMVPMYLPHVVDEPPAAAGVPMFFGGMNVYLSEKLPLFQRLPRWMVRWLDAEWLLRRLADFSSMTSARDLGELAVAMIAGDDGTQRHELGKLIAWLRTLGRVDAVILSNGLLVGLARRLSAELSCPVIATLAGEDGFLDSLIEPYRSRAWGLMAEKAEDVAAFVPVSRYYGDVMQRRLSLPASKVHVIHNGIDTTGYGPPAPPAVPTVGFLARMIPGKGLTTLVDAYLLLRQRDAVPGLRLKIGGSTVPSDRKYLDALRSKLGDAGVERDVSFHPNLSHAQKQAFLRELSVFSVPATYGEAFGLYVLESLASGTPVVQPRHAAFPELLEALGGGVLVEPDSPAALADGLERLLTRPEEARRLGHAGRQRVLQDYTVQQMTERVLRLCRGVSIGYRGAPAAAAAAAGREQAP